MRCTSNGDKNTYRSYHFSTQTSHLQIEVRQLFLDFDFLWVGHVDNSLPTGELGTSRVTCGLPAFTHYNAPWAVPTKM